MNIFKQDAKFLKNLNGKKFLITGANGMLGNSFFNQVNRFIKNAKIFNFNKEELDVSNSQSFNRYFNLKPDYVIHCAGLVNADLCEKEESQAKKVIVEGTKNVINFAKKNNAKIFYPQSFLIYNDINVIIDENTKPLPLSIYGKLKLEAENLILKSLPNTLSVRMGGFFGGCEKDTNFVGKISRHIANLIKKGENSLEVGDRIWQPTYTDDLAYNSLILLANSKKGTYCMASHGSCSFFELTKKIIDVLNITKIFKIKSVSAKILAKKEIAIRPISAVMNNKKLIKEKLDRQRKWEASLEEYLNKPYFRNLFK